MIRQTLPGSGREGAQVASGRLADVCRAVSKSGEGIQRSVLGRFSPETLEKILELDRTSKDLPEELL